MNHSFLSVALPHVLIPGGGDAGRDRYMSNDHSPGERFLNLRGLGMTAGLRAHRGMTQRVSHVPRTSDTLDHFED